MRTESVRSIVKSRGRMTILLALGVFVSAGCLPTEPAEVTLVVQDGQSETVLEWKRALEAGDLDAIADMNMPNTLLYASDKVQIKGMQDITARYASLLSEHSIRVTISDAHYLAMPPLLQSWGLFEMTLTPLKGSGEPIVMNGRFTDTATLQQGKWRYIVDHLSMPLSGR